MLVTRVVLVVSGWGQLCGSARVQTNRINNNIGKLERLHICLYSIVSVCVYVWKANVARPSITMIESVEWDIYIIRLSCLTYPRG